MLPSWTGGVAHLVMGAGVVAQSKQFPFFTLTSNYTTTIFLLVLLRIYFTI